MVVEINGVRCTILCPGESLSSIAMKYDIPKSDLLKFNETTNENSFHEGDIVFLSKKKKKYEGALYYHQVEEGETLYSISQRFGIRIANLLKMNQKDIFSNLTKEDCLKLR